MVLKAARYKINSLPFKNVRIKADNSCFSFMMVLSLLDALLREKYFFQFRRFDTRKKNSDKKIKIFLLTDFSVTGPDDFIEGEGRLANSVKAYWWLVMTWLYDQNTKPETVKTR